MLPNNIPTISPLSNSYGLPFSIMHLKTQAKIGKVRIWKMAELMKAIKNMYFCFTGTTFVFDRGKLATIIVQLFVLPVALHCNNFSQQTVSQLEINVGQYNQCWILVLLSLARFTISSTITKINELNSDTGKKNLLHSKTAIGTKSNEQISKLFPQAQNFQTVHVNVIGNPPNAQLIVNMLNPILSAERVNSNRLLITGQPVDRQNLIQSLTQQVATVYAKSDDKEYVQSLLDVQKTQLKNYWSKFLPQINNNNHEPPTVMEGVLTIRRVYSKLNLKYEPEDQ